MSVLMAETPEDTAAASEATFPGLPATHSWTLDDLARLPDDGRRYEIIDGSLHVGVDPLNDQSPTRPKAAETAAFALPTTDARPLGILSVNVHARGTCGILMPTCCETDTSARRPTGWPSVYLSANDPCVRIEEPREQPD